MKRIIILGATGSIGDSTFRVIRAAQGEFEVVGISAHNNAEKLAELAREFSPKAVSLSNGTLDASQLPEGCKLHSAPIDLLDQECDIVVAAITGAAGLLPIMRALELGRTVALANKEALVCAGNLMMDACKKHKARILPIDSEHNAVFQALAGQSNHLSHITLTASGGPFLKTPLADMAAITPEQAINHPKWNMGAKISVDSATMMNKGLELIEAHWLFDLPPEKIEIVIHPQAIIHGLAHFTDGSVIAQMSEPDMATPISHCLHWPERGGCVAKPLNLAACGTLEFHAVDESRFAAPALAHKALKQGPAACIALNAANEIVVQAFLDRRIGFMDIVPLVANISESFSKETIGSIEDVLTLDAAARSRTETQLTETSKRYA